MEDLKDLNFSTKAAKISYSVYESIGKKGKPQKGREWTLVAAFLKTDSRNCNGNQPELICFASGSKCLGKGKRVSDGSIVNDSHAEVLARRLLMRYFYDQLKKAVTNQESIFQWNGKNGNFTLKPGIRFHLFSSHTPCGDASIFAKKEDSMSTKDIKGEITSTPPTVENGMESKLIPHLHHRKRFATCDFDLESSSEQNGQQVTRISQSSKYEKPNKYRKCESESSTNNISCSQADSSTKDLFSQSSTVVKKARFDSYSTVQGSAMTDNFTNKNTFLKERISDENVTAKELSGNDHTTVKQLSSDAFGAEEELTNIQNDSSNRSGLSQKRCLLIENSEHQHIKKSDILDEKITSFQNIERYDFVYDQDSSKKTQAKSDIYRTGAKCVPLGKQDMHLEGADYHVIGALRTKPGRGERTLSMSCSDKIMKWCILGLQGGLLSNFIQTPIYMSSLIIGKCPVSREAITRAISLRGRNLECCSDDFRGFPEVYCCEDVEFVDSKRKVESEWDPQLKIGKTSASGTAILYCEECCIHEVIVNGSKQGVTKKQNSKVDSRCSVSKSALFNEFKCLLRLLEDKDERPKMENGKKTYRDFKLANSNYQKNRKEFFKTFPDWVQKPIEQEQFD